jgi:hypothetical protein
MEDNNPSEESFDFDENCKPSGKYVEMTRNTRDSEDTFHCCPECMDDGSLVDITEVGSICSNCIFGKYVEGYNGLLKCKNAVDYNDVSTYGDMQVSDQTKAYPADYEECTAELYVGVNFGCINFKKR